MIDVINLEKSKKLKKKAVLIILGLILLFFVITYFIGHYASEELAETVKGPLAFISSTVIIAITLSLNKKIEELKK